MNHRTLVAAPLMSIALTSAAFPDLQNRKNNRMTPTSRKVTASAATLLAFAFFAMTAPAARADEYCITNGAQAAHGCGYPSLETCQAATSGIGGSCTRVPSAQSTSDAQAYQPKQPHARKLRSNSTPKAPPPNDG